MDMHDDINIRIRRVDTNISQVTGRERSRELSTNRSFRFRFDLASREHQNILIVLVHGGDESENVERS
jgi:hypothetical protein